MLLYQKKVVPLQKKIININFKTMYPKIILQIGQVLTIKNDDGTSLDTVVVPDKKNEYKEDYYKHPCNNCILAQEQYKRICRVIDCVSTKSHIKSI